MNSLSYRTEPTNLHAENGHIVALTPVLGNSIAEATTAKASPSPAMPERSVSPKATCRRRTNSPRIDMAKTTP